MQIPLFLLNTVLHTGGRLPLRVFETRYLDMVRACLRSNTPFGVCLLAEGEQVGSGRAEPYRVGTLATIADWDMPQMGILNLVVHGGERFRILEHSLATSGLHRAVIQTLAPPPARRVPDDYVRLVPMLRALLEALEDAKPPEPHRFNDACWVADRWAELLPLPLTTQQQILELDDGVARLEAIYRFLEAERPGGA